MAKSVIYLPHPNAIQSVIGAVTQIGENRLALLNNRISCDLSNSLILDAQYNRTIPFTDIGINNGFMGNITSVDSNTLKLDEIRVSVPNSAALFAVKLSQVDSQNRLIQVLNLPVMLTPEAIIIKSNGRQGNFTVLQPKRSVVIHLTSTANGLKSNLIQVLKLSSQDSRLEELQQKYDLN